MKVMIAMALLVSAADASAATTPALFNMHDCKADYAVVERSLEVATRAVGPSDLKLDAIIAADAQFDLWNGDAVWSNRDLRGAAAAREFFRQINATKYVVRKALAPVCSVNTDSAVIEFISADGRESTIVTFGFKGAKLIWAKGELSTREEGQLKAGGNHG